jgi:hypothetical protein
MPALQDFLAVLQNIKESATNLGKDVDKNDRREETKADFAMMTLSFSDLKTILKNMTPDDKANLEREAKELFSGEETLADYSRDVQKILTDIKNRTTADSQVMKKIEQNMPIENKGQSPSTILDSFAQLLRQLSDQMSK